MWQCGGGISVRAQIIDMIDMIKSCNICKLLKKFQINKNENIQRNKIYKSFIVHELRPKKTGIWLWPVNKA